jgi:hypothetical protein
MFIVVNYGLSRLAVWLEGRMSRNTTGAPTADAADTSGA